MSNDTPFVTSIDAISNAIFAVAQDANSKVTKSRALNTFARSLAGQKHDWAFLKSKGLEAASAKSKPATKASGAAEKNSTLHYSEEDLYTLGVRYYRVPETLHIELRFTEDNLRQLVKGLSHCHRLMHRNSIIKTPDGTLTISSDKCFFTNKDDGETAEIFNHYLSEALARTSFEVGGQEFISNRIPSVLKKYTHFAHIIGHDLKSNTLNFHCGVREVQSPNVRAPILTFQHDCNDAEDTSVNIQLELTRDILTQIQSNTLFIKDGEEEEPEFPEGKDFCLTIRKGVFAKLWIRNVGPNEKPANAYKDCRNYSLQDWMSCMEWELKRWESGEPYR